MNVTRSEFITMDHQHQQHGRPSSQTPKLTKFYSSDDSLFDDFEYNELIGSLEMDEDGLGEEENATGSELNAAKGLNGFGISFERGNCGNKTNNRQTQNLAKNGKTKSAAEPSSSSSTTLPAIVSMKSLQNEWKERQICRAKFNNSGGNKNDEKLATKESWNGNLTENDFEKFRQIWSDPIVDVEITLPTESSTTTASTSISPPPIIEETNTTSTTANTAVEDQQTAQSILLQEREIERLRMELELEHLRGQNGKLSEANGFLFHNYAALCFMLRDADSLANGLMYKLNALKWQQQFVNIQIPFLNKFPAHFPMPLPPSSYFAGAPLPLMPLSAGPVPFHTFLSAQDHPALPGPIPSFASHLNPPFHPQLPFRPALPPPLSLPCIPGSFVHRGQHFFPSNWQFLPPSAQCAESSILISQPNIVERHPIQISSPPPPPQPAERRILQIRPPPPPQQNLLPNGPINANNVQQEGKPNIHSMPPQMPRKPTNFWNPDDCGLETVIVDEGQTACKQGLSYVHDFSSVRARFPIKLCGTGFYYFEVKIVVRNNRIWVGLSNRQFPLHTSLGYRLGWGFANFGCFFDCGRAKSYGGDYGTDDVIGCGLDLANGELFFTKNGTHLGIATKLPLPSASNCNEMLLLFPTVSMCAEGTVISANFGQSNFAWDINEAIMGMNNGSQKNN